MFSININKYSINTQIIKFYNNARVAQWLAYRSSKPGVAGSSPAAGIKTIKVSNNI